MEDLFKKEETKDEESQDSTSVRKIGRVLPIKRAIFIDSTWQQTKEIYKDVRLSGMWIYIL